MNVLYKLYLLKAKCLMVESPLYLLQLDTSVLESFRDQVRPLESVLGEIHFLSSIKVLFNLINADV